MSIHFLASRFNHQVCCVSLIRVTLIAFDSGTPQRVADPLSGMKALSQFVVWKLEQYPDEPKPRKVPYDPKTIQRADTTNPATWASFELASCIAATNPEFKIGFVFTLNDPYVFIDLDGCRDPISGEYTEEVTHIVTRLFPGAAAEISQSGSGLHLIMRGDKTQFGNRRNRWGGRFEFYQNNRFIAIASVDAWNGDVNTDHTAALQTFLPIRQIDHSNQEIETIRDERWFGPEDDLELLSRIEASDDKISSERFAELNEAIQRDPSNFVAKAQLDILSRRVPFAALWHGNALVLRQFYPSTSGKTFDHSAADLALMNKLAFWTGRDHERMIRLFNMSELGKRDKWRNRPYYRNRTASTSNLACRDVYRGTSSERREKQRQENERIGEQMEFDTTSKLLSVDEMVESFYFITLTGASGSVANAKNLSVISVSVARNEYAPSKSTITYVDNRNGQTKQKIMPTFELWLPHEKRKRADAVTWNPNGNMICEPPEKPGVSAFNIWRGLIKPKFADHFFNDDPLRERWLSAWREHLAYLVPIESERELFEQWLAHILQRPGEKVETGWCFIATNTGIGRNWLGSVLSRVLRGYVLNNAVLDNVLEGAYNGRMSRKLIMIVDEARAGMRGANTWALSEKLKTMVNPDFREINEKHGLQWVEHNVLRWLVFSNNWDALPIEQNDRRWNFAENPSKPQSPTYYERIYDQIRRDEFIAAVWAHLSTLPLDVFKVGDRPIENETRSIMLGNLASDEELAVKEFKERWSTQVARYDKLEAFVKSKIPGRNLNRNAIKRNLMKEGMIYLDKRVGNNNDRLVIVRDLHPQQVYDNAQHWMNVATDGAARFDFDPSSGPQPGTNIGQVG
jgi:primase-polymerase (primpol)-like protein